MINPGHATALIVAYAVDAARAAAQAVAPGGARDGGLRAVAGRRLPELRRRLARREEPRPGAGRRRGAGGDLDGPRRTDPRGARRRVLAGARHVRVART